MLTASVEIAVADLAGFSVVDSVAVAQIEAVGSTETPECELNQSRKISGEFRIKGVRVNSSRNRSNDLRAATLSVASGTVGVRCAAIVKDAGPVQEVMDEGVNSDHGLACVKPDRSLLASADE